MPARPPALPPGHPRTHAARAAASTHARTRGLLRASHGRLLVCDLDWQLIEENHARARAQFWTSYLPHDLTCHGDLELNGRCSCEDAAVLSQSFDTTLSNCASGCRANASCAFYQFCATEETCTLFERCDFIQQLAVQMVNELYGIPPQGDFCRIADPEKCWKEIRRRSYLSLTHSDVPRCLFEEQYNACDALQQISGVEVTLTQRVSQKGSYACRVQGAFANAASDRVEILNAVPLKSVLQDDGRKWEGPRQSAIYTCELGPWQYIGNLSCQECIQVGTPSLGNFSSVSLPEVYFLEHRLMQLRKLLESGLSDRQLANKERQVLRACGSQQIVLKTACGSGEEEASYWQVDAASRQWNFSVPTAGTELGSSGGEFALQQLKFVPESRHPAKDISVAAQEDSGKLLPVTKVYNRGFVKWYVPGHGWALAHQQSVEDRNCTPGDVFQQWDFVKSASKDPSAATSERQLRKDTQALLQSHGADNGFVSMTDQENFVNVSNCEASLTLHDSTSASDGVDLALEIWEEANLDAQQRLCEGQFCKMAREAYQYVDHYEVVKTYGTPGLHGNGTKVLFACQAAESDQSSSQGSSCSQWASVSPEDLSKIYAAATTLMIEKVCPVLMNRSMSVSPAVAKLTNANGMTLKVLAAILRNAPYKTLPFDDARSWPFYYKGSSGERAQSMGYLSVAASGAFWGVTCPPGAVVVSEEKTLPHCLDIHASDSQEKLREVLSAYSGSATCPSGYAISGWYNLPGIKVKGNNLTGGPQNWTNLIGSCDQPSKPHCTAGHVVNAISYSQNQVWVLL
ncbi:unnamed protein product [Symbiodinium sp. KB8]|nr:unnamed protein product [Symbiodinium sp. KB8]